MWWIAVLICVLCCTQPVFAGVGAGETATYERSAGFTQVLTYGTTGNATGLVEYICAGEPSRALAHTIWQVRKLTYDSSGNVTNVQWQDGNDLFDNDCVDLTADSFS